MTVNGLNLRLSRRNRAPLLVALSIVVVVGLSIGLHQQIKNQLNAWKLLPEPERLTELYFTNPNSLPTTYTPGRAQTVRFTVHNIEYQNETYRYQIVEQSADTSKSQSLATGSFGLKQDQYQGQNVGITPVDMGQRVKIIVELPTVNETISYWVENQQ